MATFTSIACGMEAFSCGRMARTRSTVSIILAPGCRNMMTRTDGLPLAYPEFRMSSTESTARPTSEIRTAVPLLVAYHNGTAVRISDVGCAVDSVEDIRYSGYANGKPSVLVIIFRQAG